MTPDPSPDPTIHRRRLRNELRRAREAADKSQREVATAMDWSISKVIRIETSAVNISTNDLRALLNFYDVGHDRIETLVGVAKAAREAPKWSLYRDVATPEYISFLGYESSAAIIRNFEPLLVPGLLQTEEYAREVVDAIEERTLRTENTLETRVDALVDLRMQRQELLARENPPELHFIIDEAVIRRLVGGPDIMRGQLRRMRELAEAPNITMRIVPFTYGIYQRLRVPYVLFEFADPEDEDVLFIENPLGDLIIRENSPEERDRVTPVNYLGFFWDIEQVAPRQRTPEILDDAIRQLARSSQPQLPDKVERPVPGGTPAAAPD
jgi:transcriptional regulator with XRE-family HTH domain